jgi:hypothetical protein
MLEQSADTQRFTILPHEPTVEELQSIMDAAVRDNEKFYYGWTTKDEKNFALAIEHGQSIGESCEWRMFSGDGKEALEMWYLVTDDIVCIKDLIREAATTNNFGIVPQPKSSFPGGAGSSGKRHLAKARSPELTAHQTFTNIPTIDESLGLMLPKEETLKGNLKLVHITNLLQSIGMGSMSGRLRIQRHATSFADIFFQKGLPVHAEGPRAVGEDCFLQVVCWNEGDFLFEPKLKTDEQTINRSLESLILEGCLLLDNTNYLMKAGIRMTSILFQTNEDMSEKEFEQAMTKGEAIDLADLKSFYVEVDGYSSVEDIVNELDMLRSQWVPVVANLLRLNVIEISTAPSQAQQLVHPKDIDSKLVESVRQGMVSEETGIFTYPAFLFLAGIQIKCSQMPLSVMIMGAHVSRANNKGKASLSAQQVQELSLKLDKLTSSRNIFAHYENNKNNTFGVLLIGMRADKAARIADRLVKALAEYGLETLDGGDKIGTSVGVASYPDDAQDLGILLAEAERARLQALQSGVGVCMAAGDD